MRTSSGLRRRRAISGILAAVILFAMLFTTGTGYFLFISNQNNQYVTALNKFETSYRAKSTESAIVNPPSSSGSTVRIVVRNTGASVLNITALILETSTGRFMQYYAKGTPAKTNTNPALPIYISPGSISPTIDTGYSAANGVEYIVQVLTSNGNLFTGGYPFPVGQNVLLSQLSQGVGSFVLIAGSLKYYYSASTPTGTGWDVGGFYSNVLPGNTKILFSIQIQNVDPFGRAITLNQKSLLTAGGVLSSNQVWFAVQTVHPGCSTCSYLNGTAYNKAVTVPYEGTVTAYFGAASSDGACVGSNGNGCVGTGSVGSAGSPLGTFFLLYGVYGDGSPFAQTIPFAATYVSGASVTNGGTSCSNLGTTICGNQGPGALTLTLSGFNACPAPQAYWVNSDGTTQTVTYFCSGSTLQATIPSNTNHRAYYALIVDDGINAFSVEVYVN